MKNERRKLNKKRNASVSITREAARLFSAKGYLETSMNDIASAARMSKGGIYHYFTSKDEILYFILDHHIDFILDGLEQELEEIEEGLEKIEYIISRHIEIYAKNVHESKTMLHEAHNLPAKLFKNIAEKERVYYRIVASVLRNYVGPHIQKDTITAITFTLFGMCNWIYSWYNPRGPVTPRKLSNIILNIFSRGVSSVQH